MYLVAPKLTTDRLLGLSTVVQLRHHNIFQASVRHFPKHCGAEQAI
jgi:hypothetical protein